MILGGGRPNITIFPALRVICLSSWVPRGLRKPRKPTYTKGLTLSRQPAKIFVPRRLHSAHPPIPAMPAPWPDP
jgi:hypothetical protein